MRTWLSLCVTIEGILLMAKGNMHWGLTETVGGVLVLIAWGFVETPPKQKATIYDQFAHVSYDRDIERECELEQEFCY